MSMKDKNKACPNCNKPVGRRNLYCNNTCQGVYQGKEKVRLWIEGKFKPTKSTVLRYLKETYGYCCSECGLTEWNGKKITLEIDHIDGNPFNNHYTNFRFLCPNCHSQTSSFKGANKGNGRSKRHTMQ